MARVWESSESLVFVERICGKGYRTLHSLVEIDPGRFHINFIALMEWLKVWDNQLRSLSAVNFSINLAQVKRTLFGST